MDYSEFRKQYEEQHPSSVPRLEEEISIYPGWLEHVVGVMFICASLLSGVHTVPAVHGGMSNTFWPDIVVNVVSLASFLAIELVFFVAAYALMRKRQWHVMLTLTAAFIVAMVANLQQNFEAYNAGDPGTIVVAVTLGIGAPLIAFMAGKMFVDIHRARRLVGSEARKIFEADSVRWDKEVLKAFEKYQADSVRADSGRTADSRTNKRPTGYGYDRTADAKDKVRQHLEANPDDVGLSVRALADKLQVGKTTVNDVRREMSIVNGNGNHNGNGQHEE